MFDDRLHAARLLAERLVPYRGERPLVLAVPRGGVPMGEILADALDGDLDLVLVRKLVAPWNPEYALGAVAEDGEVLLRPSAAAAGFSGRWAEQALDLAVGELRRRRALFTPRRGPVQVARRTTLVVDDGVATGATLLAALRFVRARGPRRLVLAVGVAPADSLRALAAVADELVCLEQPVSLRAVGEHFADFRQVGDYEVVAALHRAASRPAEVAPSVPAASVATP